MVVPGFFDLIHSSRLVKEVVLQVFYRTGNAYSFRWWFEACRMLFTQLLYVNFGLVCCDHGTAWINGYHWLDQSHGMSWLLRLATSFRIKALQYLYLQGLYILKAGSLYMLLLLILSFYYSAKFLQFSNLYIYRHTHTIPIGPKTNMFSTLILEHELIDAKW